MAQKDNRGRRVLLKLRLSDQYEALRVETIIDKWRGQRKAAQNVTDAVLLYDALQDGDVSKLYELFPTLAKARLGAGTPAPTTAPSPGRSKKREVKHVEPDSESAIDEMLDMF